MRRRAAAVLVAAALAANPVSPARAEESADETAVVQDADRILAVVDDDPILASDVERAVVLGLLEAAPGEEATALRRRALDSLIEQRLRFHEIDRFGFAQVPVEEVEAQYAAVEQRLGGPAALEAALGEVDLDPQGLRQLLSHQLMVLVYVEERLGPRVFVSLDDIQAYYDRELAAEMAGRGEPLPPLEEVREAIRALLKERRLDDEIVRWTSELRARADVLDYFESTHEELPPVVGGR